MILPVSSKNSTSISFTWKEPSVDDQNGIITGYKIRIMQGESKVLIEKTLTKTSYIATDLNEYKSYTFFVSAINSVGGGPEANITARTDEDSKKFFNCKLSYKLFHAT